jgi:hypothetical protein
MKFERFQLATEDILIPASFSPQRLRFQLAVFGQAFIPAPPELIPYVKLAENPISQQKEFQKLLSPINYSKRSFQNSVRSSR